MFLFLSLYYVIIKVSICFAACGPRSKASYSRKGATQRYHVCWSSGKRIVNYLKLENKLDAGV